MNKSPIFIVGAPRSGTTLLAAQLSAHSEFSCGPETHFFRWLAQEDGDQLCKREQWPQQAQAFLTGITAASYSSQNRIHLIEKYGVDERQISAFLQTREPSVANILAAITVPYMDRLGKRRWIEKTPDHLEYVTQIRHHFPRSPIIRLIRDPRDVALSLCKVPWGARTLPEALLFWKRLDQASATFFDLDPLSYTLRFEDLLAAPRERLSEVCEFVGETFEEQMLDTSETGKAVNSRKAAWKEKASQPIDRSRIGVWRENLSAQENQLAEALVGDCLERYDYPRLATFTQLAEIYPGPLPTDRYTDALARLAGQSIRFWQLHENEKPATLVYLGNPGETSWLGERRIERMWRALTLSASLLRARLSHRKLFWIPSSVTGSGPAFPESTWAGSSAYLLQKLLLPHLVHPETSREDRHQ